MDKLNSSSEISQIQQAAARFGMNLSSDLAANNIKSPKKSSSSSEHERPPNIHIQLDDVMEKISTKIGGFPEDNWQKINLKEIPPDIKVPISFSKLTEHHIHFITRLFIDFLALRSRLLFLKNDIVVSDCIKIILKQFKTDVEPPSPDLNSLKKEFLTQNQFFDPLSTPRGADFKGFPPLSKELRIFVDPSSMVIDLMEKCEILKTCKIHSAYKTVYESLEAVNFTIAGISQRDASFLLLVLRFLDAPLSKKIYQEGEIEEIESNAFSWKSPIGPIQVGIPPETLKSSVNQGKPVPQIFILPSSLLFGDTNLGETEFPIYWNYFVKGAFKNPENKAILIGSPDHLQRMRILFRESLYGPDELFVDEEIDRIRKEEGYEIKLREEMLSFAIKVKGQVAELDEFCVFQPLIDGKTSLKKTVEGKDYEIRIEVQNGSFFQFFENNERKAAIHYDLPTRFSQKELPPILETPSLFDPPTFGITFIGTSHGFDPKGHTTGFIIWVNGRGILVDPPVQTTGYLRENRIPNSIVKDIILTHCHSDHDSGVLKKILEGDKITLYTTKTIHSSYDKKVTAIAGKSLRDFYEFVPVPIGRKIDILGAQCEFDYSLHTIPTIRFRISYGGKTISYSCDTNFDVEKFADLKRQGIINPLREMQLRNWLFNADLIVHESGVPPIHTTIASLNDLPDDIKKKMYIVHCSSIPQTVERTYQNQKIQVPVKHLQIPKTGLQNTIKLFVGETAEGYAKASRRIRMLTTIFFLRRLSPQKLYELFSCLEELNVSAGSKVIEAGEKGRDFFIIEHGLLKVEINGKVAKTLLSGEIFGENALRKVTPRNADIIAITDCRLLRMDSHRFLQITEEDSKIAEDIGQLNYNRSFFESLLSRKTYLFDDISEEQARVMLTLMKEKCFTEGSTIVQEGEKDRSFYLIFTGSVRVVKQSVMLKILEEGECFGEISLIKNAPRNASVIANEAVTILELDSESFELLLKRFQNLKRKLTTLVEEKLEEDDSFMNYLQEKKASGLPIVSHSLSFHPDSTVDCKATSPSKKKKKKKKKKNMN